MTHGNLRVTPREVLPLPPKGKVYTYFFTCAQNNTDLHDEAWRSLQTLAAHDQGRIMCSRLTYATNSRAAAGQKKTSRETAEVAEWWDSRLEPYFVDRSVQIAPGLVWCGELQILPTAVNPISGLESYTGRASAILPHVTFAVEAVPGPKSQRAKHIYTTGTVTQRNYIQKKAGQKAEFHHSYGALLVEVCSDGAWFARQLNADSEGVIYDLGRRVAGGKVTYGHRPEALVWGDIHTRWLSKEMRGLAWGAGGILDSLRPKRQVMHDVLDFRSQNHHDREDPWKTFKKWVDKGLSVADEIDELGAFLEMAARPWCETAIAAANHDEALMRWLREADFREDPANATFMLEASLATYLAIKSGRDDFYPVQWAVERRWGKIRKTRWLRRDEDYSVCDDANGGIKLDMHGDIGAGGARGSAIGFARTGNKCVVAHGHFMQWRQGCVRVGVMAALDMGYNLGMSNWSHSNALVYPNAKRALFTIHNGMWCAPQEKKTRTPGAIFVA